MLKVIELFAGIGSQTQALKNAGIPHEVVAIAEIDDYAVKSYEALHGLVNNLGDICKISELPRCDLITYSFPCQSISKNGTKQGLKKGSATKSSLLWEVERLLGVARSKKELPKYLVLENVKNLVGVQFKPVYLEWLHVLEEYGYNTYWEVLNAVDYGVPQKRERVFAVSVRKDIDKAGTFCLGDKVTPKTTLGGYLNIRFTEEDEDFPATQICAKTGSPTKMIKYIIPKQVKVRVYGVDIPSFVTMLREHKQTKHYSNKDIAEQLGLPLTQVEHWFRKDNYNSLPDTEIWFKLKVLLEITQIDYDEALSTYAERDGVYDQTNRVYDVRGVAPTLTTSSVGIRVTDGRKIRTLTVQEVWRLMGQSETALEKISGEVSEAQLYKQAGNSIVVPILEGIFAEIHERERGNTWQH